MKKIIEKIKDTIREYIDCRYDGETTIFECEDYYLGLSRRKDICFSFSASIKIYAGDSGDYWTPPAPDKYDIKIDDFSCEIRDYLFDRSLPNVSELLTNKMKGYEFD